MFFFVIKLVCLLMNLIRGKDLERFKELNFLFNILVKEIFGWILLLCLENRRFVFVLKLIYLVGDRE